MSTFAATNRQARMKTVLIMVGRTTEKWIEQGMEDYCSRLTHFAPFEIITVPELKNTKSMDTKVQKELEADAILRLLQPSDDVMLLDEKGLEMTSEQTASWLDRKLQGSAKRLVFIIGGPYGFSDRVYAAAGGKLSLSRMTFSHQMVRVIFVEQLYRAFTIMKGLPYHHS